MKDIEWIGAETIAHNHFLIVLMAHALAESKDPERLAEFFKVQFTTPVDMPESWQTIAMTKANEIIEDLVLDAERHADELREQRHTRRSG